MFVQKKRRLNTHSFITKLRCHLNRQDTSLCTWQQLQFCFEWWHLVHMAKTLERKDECRSTKNTWAGGSVLCRLQTARRNSDGARCQQCLLGILLFENSRARNFYPLVASLFKAPSLTPCSGLVHQNSFHLATLWRLHTASTILCKQGSVKLLGAGKVGLWQCIAQVTFTNLNIVSASKFSIPSVDSSDWPCAYSGETDAQANLTLDFHQCFL